MENMKGPFHYEDIPARGKESRFRVGDFDDDVVCDFPTEEAAQAYVRKENQRYANDIPTTWKF